MSAESVDPECDEPLRPAVRWLRLLKLLLTVLTMVVGLWRTAAELGLS